MKKAKKLTLNKETLRTLNAEALKRAVGGLPPPGPRYSGGCNDITYFSVGCSDIPSC